MDAAQYHDLNAADGTPLNIRCIDAALYRPGVASCYLLESDGRYAFIETGTYNSVAPILALLDELNIGVEQVDYIIPTHVHLDHAGGAGRMVEVFPNAQVFVHPSGSKHLIDPAKLKAGTLAVYGEKVFAEVYGDLIPIPAERVSLAEDGQSITFGSRTLTFLDSPGHAYHHICIWDEQTQGWFTGDTFGLSYRELDTEQGPFIMPTTTPVQFDPQAWQSSLDGMMVRQPQRMYLTHYSMVEDVARMADELREGIAAYVDIAIANKDEKNRHEALRSAILQHEKTRARAHGCTLEEAALERVLFMDQELSAQGLGVWLQKQAKQTQS